MATVGSVDEALERVLRPGQDIVVAQGSSYPARLVAALAAHRDRLAGSRLLFGLIPGDLPDLPGCEIRTFFPSGGLGTEAELRRRGATYDRLTLYELSEGLRSGRIPVDVVLGQATPAREGVHNLGVNLDFIGAAVERAGLCVVETSADTPWVRRGYEFAAGDGVIAVPGGAGPQAQAPEASPGPSALADHLLAFIPDGAAIEVGMGRWFWPLVDALAKGRRKLRIHSGSIGDWVTILREAGALDPHVPVVGTAARGSRAFFDNLRDRDDLILRPAYVTHAPKTLAALGGFRAINSVLEVDLAGRANCETGPGGRVGGIGGLPDFARAAASAEDGLSILVLNATAGPRSRILARLPGAPSLTEDEVDVVVTEYGAAFLRGLDLESRARRLVEIAAPEHRAALRAEIKA